MECLPPLVERLEPREFFSASSTLTTPAGPDDRSDGAVSGSSTITVEVKPSEAKESFTRRKPQVPLASQM